MRIGGNTGLDLGTLDHLHHHAMAGFTKYNHQDKVGLEIHQYGGWDNITGPVIEVRADTYLPVELVVSTTFCTRGELIIQTTNIVNVHGDVVVSLKVCLSLGHITRARPTVLVCVGH